MGDLVAAVAGKAKGADRGPFVDAFQKQLSGLRTLASKLANGPTSDVVFNPRQRYRGALALFLCIKRALVCWMLELPSLQDLISGTDLVTASSSCVHPTPYPAIRSPLVALFGDRLGWRATGGRWPSRRCSSWTRRRPKKC